VVVRATWGILRFWTCEGFPYCTFASWRPRVPESCPVCSSPLFYSHSRKTIRCGNLAWCGFSRPNVKRETLFTT
jgi:ssDNA-binding Zn-finger/Zn-ribbon topoisomerase 1